MELLPIYLSYLMIVQIILGTTVAADDQSYKILKFGDTTGDYIKFKPDMQPFSDAFSVCSWIRKLTTGIYRFWFSYAASGSLSDEIVISDDGSYNGIFNSYSTNVQSQAGVSSGVWHHYCMCWSVSSMTSTIYHNGRQTGSRLTPSGRRLTPNGYLVLGQDQDSYGGGFSSSQSFGGELYKLNVYSKKLSSTEVSEMYSAGRCSDVEKKHGDTRQLKWETILLQPRTGNVTIIDTCLTDDKIVDELAELRRELEATQADLNETKASNEEISNQLNRTMMSLANELKEVKVNLEETEQRLNQTLTELENTKSSLSESETVAANVSRELKTTTTELGHTKMDIELIEGELNETRKELEATQTDLHDTKASIMEEIANRQNQTIVSLDKMSNELQEVKEETGQRLIETLTELEDTESSLSESETVAANVSRELKTTKTELGLTKAVLERTVKELEEMKEALSENNCFRAADSSHWDLLYSRCYFNTVLTEEKLGMLNGIWKKLEYFMGMTVTEGLIEFLKNFHDGQDRCDL